MNQSVTTDAFFTNIKQKLLAEFELAEQTVFAAVAWFTDRELLAALISRQRAGVRVSLAVTQDPINNRLDFEDLVAAGGTFYRIDGALMHNKFCVLDGRDVITGSYNWTYRAASENYENIIVTAGDYDLAYRYLAEFNRITGNEKTTSAEGADLGKVVRRMQAIRSLVQLDEPEDVLRQARRLSTEWANPLAGQLYEHLEAGRYGFALELLENFISIQSRVTVYEDPRVAALKLEIRDLEYRIVAVEGENAEARKQLSQYNHEFSARVGKLVEEILALKRTYAHTHRQESQYSQSEYEEAKRRYEEFRQEREEEEQKAYFNLDADARIQLKQLHRQCVMQCHPDKVSEELQGEAAEIFRQVQDCYNRQDIQQLQELAERLKRGLFRPIDITQNNRLELLQARRDRMCRQLDELTRELESMRTNDTYQEITAVIDWETYWANLQQQLNQELINWKAYVDQPQSA